MSDRSTIVLMHGLTIIRRAGNQFIGVPEALRARGYRVHRTLVQGGGSLAELAERAWGQIDPLEGPLVLLCHSMGGLQARTFLLDEQRARRIATIVTVGTPHLGFVGPRLFGPMEPAYREMTVQARARWLSENGAVEDRNASRFGVRRLSVVAALDRSPGYRRLEVPHRLLRMLAGRNDGLVPAESQHWGDVLFEVDLDHMECACVAPAPQRQDESIAMWLRMAAEASAPVVTARSEIR